MERKNRIVIFGGSGYIGRHLVKASVSLGHPTLVYTRPLNSQTSSSKTQLCRDFTSMGVTLVQVFFFFHSIFKQELIYSSLNFVERTIVVPNQSFNLQVLMFSTSLLFWVRKTKKKKKKSKVPFNKPVLWNLAT